VLKTDLLIGEKLLDEGKQMGLIGKEPPLDTNFDGEVLEQK